MADAPAFSRSGKSNPLGKCTEEWKTVIDEQSSDLLVALSVGCGVSRSELLREIIYDRLYGAHRHLQALRNHPGMPTAGIGREDGE